MLRSGLTLLGALQAAGQNAEGLRMRLVLASVMGRIDGGGTFAGALEAEGVFGDLTVQLARVGEETGSLDVVLERAADAIERRRQLVQQVVTALAYPLLVLVAAVGVTLFMVLEVIPRLEGLMKSLGRKLPPTTMALIEASTWARAEGPWWLMGLLLLASALGLAFRMPGARVVADRWMLAVPLVGEVLRVAGSAMFARAFAILLRSGVTVLDGLRTAEALAGNRHLASVVARAREGVLGGGALSEGLGGRGGFVPMLGRMVAVGEATGRLEEVLEEVARHLEGQLAVRVRRLSALVEPAIIVLVGGIVGFVYVTFFLTLYAAAGNR
jgi:type IV pilus assembly protein PilC